MLTSCRTPKFTRQWSRSRQCDHEARDKKKTSQQGQAHMHVSAGSGGAPWAAAGAGPGFGAGPPRQWRCAAAAPGTPQPPARPRPSRPPAARRFASAHNCAPWQRGVSTHITVLAHAALAPRPQHCRTTRARHAATGGFTFWQQGADRAAVGSATHVCQERRGHVCTNTRRPGH